MRAESGGTSRPLKLILMPSNGYTVPYIKDLVGPNTLIYIRPMKTCLSLEKIPVPITSHSPQTECPKCFQTIPIIELRKHSFTCSAIEVSDSSGDEELQSSPFDDKVLNESASCAASSAKQGCSSGASFIDEGIASLPSLFPDVPIENVRETLVKYENVNLAACALMTSGTDVNKKIEEIQENKEDVHDI